LTKVETKHKQLVFNLIFLSFLIVNIYTYFKTTNIRMSMILDFM